MHLTFIWGYKYTSRYTIEAMLGNTLLTELCYIGYKVRLIGVRNRVGASLNI